MAPRQSSILDRSGKPFVVDDLGREVGGPTVSGVRRHPDSAVMRGITPQRLAAILEEVKAGTPDRYFELAEEMEERDPHYASVLGTRKRAVAQLAIKVEASSDDPRDVKIADTFRAWTRRKTLQAELLDLLDAVGKGMSCIEIVWDHGEVWMPSRLVHRPMSWFQFDPVERETPRLRSDSDPTGLELAPGKWLVHRHPAKSGLTTRSGVAYLAAWTVMFSCFSVADWVAFASTYGQPLRLGKYPQGTTDREIRALMRAVASLGSDAAAVIPSAMTMDIIEAAKSDGAMFAALASYFNRLKSKLVLGQETTTEAIAGGHAVSKEQNEVRGDIRDADAVLVADTLQTQLVDVWTRLNFAGATPPIISLDFEGNEDVAATLEGAFGIADRGGRVQVKQLRDKLGLVEPGEGDELLTGRQAAPAAVATVAPPPAAANSLRSWLMAGSALSVETAANAVSQVKRQQEYLDQIEEALAAAGQPVLDGWVGQVRTALNEATSLEDFALRMMSLYPELETRDLATVMGQAMALANLSGRDLDG